MTFELLVSAVNADVEELVHTMNISSNAVLVNQCGEDSTRVIDISQDASVRVFNSSLVGVGNSRNMALEGAVADICLFADEDIVYESDYETKVLEAFNKHPEASVITFNVIVDKRRRTYFNEDVHDITWKNYGRYPAYAIAIRREPIIKNNIRYSTQFGGGAKYSCGEDSLFLHDCLKAGLDMVAETAVLGAETYRESTWFKGYNAKFFFDRGVLYHFLYGKLALAIGARFLLKNKKVMLNEISFLRAFTLLADGVKEGRNIS